MTKMLNAAEAYLERGLAVIPVNSEKRPYIKWTKYQTEKPTQGDIGRWWRKWPEAMIGIITGNLTNLFVLDCDSDERYAYVQSFFPESFMTPVSQTPRPGYHLYFSMPEENLTIAAGVKPDLDFRANGGYIIAPPSSANGNKHYQWLVDIKEISPQPIPSRLFLEIKQSLEKKAQAIQPKQNDYTILQKGHRDSDLFRIGMGMADGRIPEWMIRQTLERLAVVSEPPFDLKEIPSKVKSIMGRLERKERNIAEEVREYFAIQSGFTNIRDIQQTLGLTTREEKKYLAVILVRMQEEGLIEKYGKQRGVYRPVETNVEPMEFIEEEIFEFPVRLPFGLNDVCSIYPQNIIVVAGTKSAGKTALLLNMALINQDRMPVVYLNSEMHVNEWAVRLKNLGVRSKKDVKFTALKCHENFHDHITKEKKIWIVDYLEIHDNFFEIAKPIRQIHEKLQDGICIIALQKKFGQFLGRGAEFSMEKSRLYLSLDFLQDELCSKLTIIDAKASKLPQSATGLYKRIKIIHGANIEALDVEWRRDRGQR
ncbi:MAG: bifunctional DNA primase/polymerase [Candidatus Margulisiibacteriota bacterium]